MQMNSPLTPDRSTSQQVVLFPPDRGIGVLAVAPPYPLGHKPQSDGALGINIAMVHSDLDGLLCYILAYLNMAIGDQIRIFIETRDLPVAEFTVTDAHFDVDGQAKNIPFYISAEDLESRFTPLKNENKDFWYTVERVSGNGTDQSPPIPMFYKYPAPGEADTDGGKPFNQGLMLAQASESVIDKTVINDGMFVTVLEYFNQSIGDVVVLAFGSLRLKSIVTELGDIVFELTPELLETLAPTNSLVVRWLVFDVVENSSGWSDSLLLTYKPGIVLLTAPIFEQADADNVVNHDWLVGGPMSILVTGVFSANDVVTLTLNGVTQSGVQVTDNYSQTLIGSSRTLAFPIENERVRNLIRGSLRATYKLTRAGKAQQSKPADITISGSSLPLGSPLVEPLVDGKLPVDTATASVTVAPYWPLKKGADVKLHWQTTDMDGTLARFTFGRTVTDPTEKIVFQISKEYIERYASTPLTVQNTITNPGEVEVFSELTELMIGDAVQIVLPPPFPVQPATVLIDPLAALSSLRVKYPAAVAKDRARLILRQLPGGIKPFPLTPLDSNNEADFVLNRPLMVTFQGKTAAFSWNLNRNGKKIASSAAVEISFLPIADEDARFPTPRITGVSGVVEVKKLTSKNTLVVNSWTGQAPGQAQFLWFEGTDESGVAVRYDVLKGELTGTTFGLAAGLPLEWLQRLKDGTSLRIFFDVRFWGNSKPLAFPRQTYQVESLVELQPVITSIMNSANVDIPHGDTTIDTTVTVEGTASIEQPIEILVNGDSKIELTTKADGSFSTPVSGFAFDVRTDIQIRALYGNNLTSPVRSFIVRRALQINSAAMALHGYRVYTGWPTTGLDFIGNTEIRTAAYGVPPISYVSSNPGVASVDGNGKVTGVRNGSAFITVQDRFSRLTYSVSVRNVFTLAIHGAPMGYGEAINWMNSVPGSIPLTAAISAMQRVYGGDYYWPLNSGGIYGMCDYIGCASYHGAIYQVKNGGYVCVHISYIKYWPWCLRPY